MDAAFHLHPTLVVQRRLPRHTPRHAAGHYNLYGDVVHASGFAETLLASVDVPVGMPGRPLDPEDASAAPAPLSQGELGASYKLPDGYTMVWDRPASLTASTGYSFRFHLLDPQGKPATGMEPYLGMAGHAAFIKTDGTVFAHTHPEGSAAMADVMLAERQHRRESMTWHVRSRSRRDVDFPYGFPTPGRYRIFIQMKHSGTRRDRGLRREARYTVSPHKLWSPSRRPRELNLSAKSLRPHVSVHPAVPGRRAAAAACCIGRSVACHRGCSGLSKADLIPRSRMPAERRCAARLVIGPSRPIVASRHPARLTTVIAVSRQYRAADASTGP